MPSTNEIQANDPGASTLSAIIVIDDDPSDDSSTAAHLPAGRRTATPEGHQSNQLQILAATALEEATRMDTVIHLPSEAHVNVATTLDAAVSQTTRSASQPAPPAAALAQKRARGSSSPPEGAAAKSDERSRAEEGESFSEMELRRMVGNHGIERMLRFIAPAIARILIPEPTTGIPADQLLDLTKPETWGRFPSTSDSQEPGFEPMDDQSIFAQTTQLFEHQSTPAWLSQVMANADLVDSAFDPRLAISAPLRRFLEHAAARCLEATVTNQHLQDYILVSGGHLNLEATVEFTRVRLLQDALREKDRAFLLIHLLHCNHLLTGPDALPHDLAKSRDMAGLDVLAALLPDSERITAARLRFLAAFPLSGRALLCLAKEYRAEMPAVVLFIAALARSWPRLVRQWHSRGFPPLVEEMVQSLHVTSVIMQRLMFTALHRSMWGTVEDEAFRQTDEAFLKHQRHHATRLDPTKDNERRFRRTTKTLAALRRTRLGLAEPTAGPRTSVTAVPSGTGAAARCLTTPMMHPAAGSPAAGASAQSAPAGPSNAARPRDWSALQVRGAARLAAARASVEAHSVREVRRIAIADLLNASAEPAPAPPAIPDLDGSSHSRPMSPMTPATIDQLYGAGRRRGRMEAVKLQPTLVAWLVDSVSASLAISSGGQGLFLSVVGLALRPTLLPARGGSCKLSFAVQPAAFRSIAATAEELGESAWEERREITAGARLYRMRCCKMPVAMGAVEADQWMIKDVSWPGDIRLFVNGRIHIIRRPPVWDKEHAVDVTGTIRAGSNRIEMLVVPRPDDGPYPRAVAIEEIGAVTAEMIAQSCLTTGLIPVEVTSNRLQAAFWANVDDFGERFPIQMWDKSCQRPLLIPVRGVDCVHLECFDLASFLERRRGYTAEMTMPSLDEIIDKWACPICGCDARPMQLRVDGLMLEIAVQIFDPDRRYLPTVMLERNGVWHLVEEDEGQGEGLSDIAEGSEEAHERRGFGNGDDADEDMSMPPTFAFETV